VREVGLKNGHTSYKIKRCDECDVIILFVTIQWQGEEFFDQIGKKQPTKTFLELLPRKDFDAQHSLDLIDYVRMKSEEPVPPLLNDNKPETNILAESMTQAIKTEQEETTSTLPPIPTQNQVDISSFL